MGEAAGIKMHHERFIPSLWPGSGREFRWKVFFFNQLRRRCGRPTRARHESIQPARVVKLTGDVLRGEIYRPHRRRRFACHRPRVFLATLSRQVGHSRDNGGAVWLAVLGLALQDK